MLHYVKLLVSKCVSQCVCLRFGVEQGQLEIKFTLKDNKVTRKPRQSAKRHTAINVEIQL